MLPSLPRRSSPTPLGQAWHSRPDDPESPKHGPPFCPLLLASFRERPHVSSAVVVQRPGAGLGPISCCVCHKAIGELHIFPLTSPSMV